MGKSEQKPKFKKGSIAYHSEYGCIEKVRILDCVGYNNSSAQYRYIIYPQRWVFENTLFKSKTALINHLTENIVDLT